MLNRLVAGVRNEDLKAEERKSIIDALPESRETLKEIGKTIEEIKAIDPATLSNWVSRQRRLATIEMLSRKARKISNK